LAENVVVQLDSAFDYEKYLLSWVILTVQSIIFVNLHLAEKRQHLPYELLIFVVKESDLSHDLAMSV